ncbi:17873_t:CDS:1, partial [Racocetra persica]
MNSPNAYAVSSQPPARMKRQSPIDSVLPIPSKNVKTPSSVDAILLPPTREKIITLQHISMISSWIDRRSTTYD